MQTGSSLQPKNHPTAHGRALWQATTHDLAPPVTVSALALALLPRLRTELPLRWAAMTQAERCVAVDGPGPMAVGDTVAGDAGWVVVPCRFGGSVVATLLAMTEGPARPEVTATLDALSDGVAAIVAAAPLPGADNDEHLRTNQLRLLSLLAAGLAHEVRNPLLVARSYLDLMADELDQLSADTSPSSDTLADHRHFHAEALQAIRQAMAVVTDYRAIAVAGSQVETMALVEVIHDVVRLVRPAVSPGPAITVAAPAAPRIQAKRSQVKQVLLNLLINACQAAGNGGNVLITVSDDEALGEAVVTVGNDGRSIPADVIPNLFKPLVTSKNDSGTGLGLAISQMLAQRMGGQITVDSRADWTTFSLTLPMVQSL